MAVHSQILSSIAAASVWLGAASGGAIAQMPHEGMEPTEQAEEFRQIEQPLWLKGVVTAGGLGLIGLELWWFVFSKPRSRKATTQGGVQEITVTVDGGYEPSQIVVQAGQPVRLNFDRRDPSSCLEEVRFPDFRIAQELPLNQTTPIEFIPDKPGKYEFTCGMNMFRGVVEAQADRQAATALASPLQERMGHLQGGHVVEHSAHHLEDSEPSHPTVTAVLTSPGIQEATVTVAKGYQPKRVIVEAGYPVRLHFNRQNPSSCYDQLLIPEFAIAIDLKPETTTVEFTPERVGEYEFMCGMKMNRGIIEVRASNSTESKQVAEASP